MMHVMSGTAAHHGTPAGPPLPDGAPADAGAGTAAELQQEVARPTVTYRLRRLLHAQSTLGPTVVLVLSVVLFSIWADNFLKPFNFSLILQQVQVVGILALGQTLVVLTAGIDLSVGSMMVLSSVVMGKLAVDAGLPPGLALGLGLLCGAACGLANGLLVTRFKLPPFIATLGTLNIFFALNLAISESETIRAQDVPSLLRWTGNSFDVWDMRITYGSLLMVGLFAGVAYALRWTSWGQHVYATGDDREAARLAGIRTNRVLLSVYIVAGLICAVAGWVLIGRIGSVSPQSGQTANLDSITAVVIGGTSLFGGRGRVFGTLLGALIVGVFRNGLSLAGVDVLWQDLAVGVLIIVAVALDQWIRKVQA